MMAWLRVVQAQIRVTARNKLLLVPIVLTIMALLLPVALALPTGGAYIAGRDAVETQQTFLSEQLSSGAYRTAPAKLVELKQQEVSYLQEALALPIEDAAGYFSALARRARTVEEEHEYGYVQGAENELSFAANALLLERIALLGAPEVYDTAADMPAIYLLAFSIGSTPYIFWYLVPVAVMAIAGRRLDRRLVSQGRMGIRGSACATGLAGALVSLACLLICLIIPFVIASMRNGMGDPSYPVVLIRDNTLVSTTVGVQIAAFLALQTAIYIALCSIAAAVLMCKGGSVAAAIIMTLLIAAPLFELYYAHDVPWAPLLTSLLPTYLNSASVLGGASYLNTSDIALVTGAGGAHAIIVPLMWGAAALGFANTVSMMPSQRRWGWCSGIGDRAISGTNITSPTRVFDIVFDTVAYRRNPILNKAHVQIQPGEIIGLIAPNGAGKTTLLQALNGTGHATVRGSLQLGGFPLCDRSTMRTTVFLLSDSELLFPAQTVRFHLELTIALWETSKNAREEAERFDLAEYLNTPVHKLSQGNRQLLLLCMACTSNASILLLDEPMNALDPLHVELVSTALREHATRGAIVVISSHMLWDLETLCDRTLFIAEQHVIEIGGETSGSDINLNDIYRRIYQHAT
ncbi:ABC transporter ATP-binding protein [Collinsella tanakaei]|nr:ABC transporter ATP-binding protein [Collinsella tanakaei]